MPTPAITLLHAGFVYDEELKLDLYGWREEDGEHVVDTVRVHGTEYNVTTLLSYDKLRCMAMWLDLKDSHPESAERHRHAVSLNY